MNILIACEESQTLCTAFRSLGHSAFSCDLQLCSGNHPEWHIPFDCLPILDGYCSFYTQDNVLHSLNSRWDLIIAHPPCTFLTKCSNRAFSLNASSPEYVVQHWESRSLAAVFFMRCYYADCPRVCIENPIGFMSTAFRKPDQIIQPYMFSKGSADSINFVTKATCLWLRGLPPLIIKSYSPPNNGELFGYSPTGKAYTWCDSVVHNSIIRSKTFPGIALAMASQWGT